MAHPDTGADAGTPSAQKTCFVVTGFGKKTDPATGRVLNLDRTFRQLIQPACDLVGINCFRAIDANLTGHIDTLMYRWIYEADIVIADLSTLNANVFYELGVRHAQRPNTTVIIAESVLMERIPFDLSSFVIHAYDHAGEDIDTAERERFVGHLSGVLGKILEQERVRLATSPGLRPESDSPVFISLKQMAPPEYKPDEFLPRPDYIPPEQRGQEAESPTKSISTLCDAADHAISGREFDTAIEMLQAAVDTQIGGESNRKPDTYLIQRLALATYKAGEKKDDTGELDTAAAISALLKAEDLLETYCAPKVSTDPETLGLSGAINKRLFDLTGDPGYLQQAIRFYERGFYIKQDYYNGINVAFMYTQQATLLEDRFDAIVSYGHANKVREQVVDICQNLIIDEDAMALRGDRAWIFLTMAEAFRGLGQNDRAERLERKVKDQVNDMAWDSYSTQQGNLEALVETFEAQLPPSVLGMVAPQPGPDSAPNAQPRRNPQAGFGQTTSDSGEAGAITIRPDIAPGRSVKSVKVTCRVEYD